MIRGIYTSCSGMLVQQAENEIIANNLANVNTPGFKKDIAVFSDFPTMLTRRINDYKEKLNDISIDFRPAVGMTGSGAVLDQVYTSKEPGIFTETGNNMDFALEGEGFFAVETEGGIRFTRSGNFRVGTNGLLITQDGHPILAQAEPVLTSKDEVAVDSMGNPAINTTRVNIPEDGNITINESGQVMIDGMPRLRLMVVKFDDPDRIFKVGNNLYENKAGLGGDARNALDTKIHQGCLEQSNANVVEEMVRLITCFRAYEMNQHSITNQDKTLDKAVNTVPRIN